MNKFLSELKNILNDKQIITNEEQKRSFIESPRGFFENKLAYVLLPNSTLQISQILQLCNKYKQSIIPQGGNTGLVGAQQGVRSKNNIVLSLKKLNKIHNINKYDYSVVAEAGVVLNDLHNYVAKENLMFPMQLASQQSCQIGGNLATNAGGLAVLSYGTMRDLCLGLEVVLADGRILNDLRIVKKDNMGYDLKNLFIGSEGTLGIITKASLKLYPKPVDKYICYMMFANITDVLNTYNILKQNFSLQLTSYELISDIAMHLSLNYMQSTRNFLPKTAAWYVLLEVSIFNIEDNLKDRLENLLQNIMQQNLIIDAIFAQSIRDAEYFWQIRENISAAQKYVNVSIKNDISIPLINIEDFLNEADKQLSKIVPDSEFVIFGHIGDGNLHYNIMAPKNIGKEFLEFWQPISEIINELTIKYKGSIAAEHGIGQLKNQFLAKYKNPVAYKLMQDFKKQLDPNNILNPEKLFY